MTAADMYKAAVDARRAQLYGKIKSCALAGDFRARVYRDSLDRIEDVLDEFEKNGFRVDRSDSDIVEISWESGLAKTAFNQ
jgi:hypothetical protein